MILTFKIIKCKGQNWPTLELVPFGTESNFTMLFIILFHITCTKILVLRLVHYINYFKMQMTKHPTALCLGWQECNNYLPLHLSLYIYIIVIIVFPIRSSDVCSKARLFKKTTCETLHSANATGVVRAFRWRKRPRDTPRVELDARLVKCFLWAKIIFNAFSFNFV